MTTSNRTVLECERCGFELRLDLPRAEGSDPVDQGWGVAFIRPRSGTIPGELDLCPTCSGIVRAAMLPEGRLRDGTPFIREYQIEALDQHTASNVARIVPEPFLCTYMGNDTECRMVADHPIHRTDSDDPGRHTWRHVTTTAFLRDNRIDQRSPSAAGIIFNPEHYEHYESERDRKTEAGL